MGVLRPRVTKNVLLPTQGAGDDSKAGAGKSQPLIAYSHITPGPAKHFTTDKLSRPFQTSNNEPKCAKISGTD